MKELQGDQRMLKEEVEAEDIALIVAKWTGIPVNRMMEGEVGKLLKMGDRQDQGGGGVREGAQEGGPAAPAGGGAGRGGASRGRGRAPRSLGAARPQPAGRL